MVRASTKPLSENTIISNKGRNAYGDKHQNRKVLVLFLCFVANRAEQFGAIQNKLEHVGTGHSENPITANINTYLCIVNPTRKRSWWGFG